MTLDPALSPSRWVTEKEFHASAVSTAMKKVLGGPGPFLSSLYLPGEEELPSIGVGHPPNTCGLFRLQFSSGLSCASFRC